MGYFRHPSLRSLFVLLALTSLLLQAQSAFACPMMDAAGPIQDCCCVEPMNMAGPTTTCDESASCCEFSVELYPHSLDASWAPLWDSLPLDRSPAYVSVIPHRVDNVQLHSVSPDFYHIDPSSPGTQTYLATLRLRI